MELEEEEGQVCRLCGQCENIFIDVFGEEGTKRLLGVKIQTKVNILIDERDPLPKTICVQCLGKLEFVCDFQEECLRTQQVLHDRYNLPPLGDLEKSIESTGVPTTRLETTAATATARDGSTTAMATAATVSSSPNPGPTESVEEQPEYRVLRNSKNSSQRVTRSSRARQEPAISAPPPPPPAPAPSTALLPNTDGDLPIFRVTENGERLDPIIDGTSSSSSSSSSSLSSSGSPEFSCSSSERDLNANVVQIPTLALNKLLTMVSNSPNIDISVKESTNRSGNVEDISFTVELCKKEPATEEGAGAVVRARVFPDQGSCLVDTTIVGLLEKQSSVLVNSIINSIAAAGGSGGKDGADGVAKFDELEFLEERLSGTQNPEELFRVDGEEIRVDENVEPAMLDQQSGYACKLCKKFYERKDKCTVHVKTHLGIKQYACTLCTARFVCKSDVMKHIRCSHTNPRPIQCPKCPKRFRSKFYLTEHDNVHKGVRPYRCSDCGQSYHHKVSLQIHAKSHLPPQNLACEYCGKVFPFRTRLLSHVGSVHMKNRRNFRCRFCYNLYSSLAVLNEHIKTRHATTYTCDICGKTFKVASKYKAHVSQHTNPKPYVCNVCNNRYASKAFLNEHLLKHEGLRKHKCQKCGASFAQASHLAAHRHVHGEKTHACPECGRMFNRRDNMKVHRKRHFEQQAKKAPGAGSAAAVGGEQSKGLVAKDDPETKGLLGLQASNENEK